MSETTAAASSRFIPFSVQLTREELVLIVRLMDRDNLIGVEEDPLGTAITPQLQAYGLVCAERSLRAREMALIDETGTLRVRNDVFSNIGICVFAQQIFIVNNLGADRKTTDRMVLFTANGEAVGMVSPAPALHKFVKLPNRAMLFDELVSASVGREPLETTASFALTLPQAVLAAARDTAALGDLQATVKTLSTSSNSTEATHALATTLCAAHTVTVVHAIVPQPEQKIQAQEFTIVRGPELAWLMFKTDNTGEGARPNYSITAINGAQLRAIMQTLFATAS